METKSNYDNKTERAGWIKEFLWSCAGVDKDVLRQCPSDHSKFAGIGGTILFTALMAVLSGGYAMTFVFGNPYVGVLFGMFWGMLIFNLDRFIVNTMYSDGKVTISWQELKSGMPRIIMAIFLGIVISYPLELKIFDDEISVKIEELKADRLREYVGIDQARLDSLNTVISDMQDKPSTPVTVSGDMRHINDLQDKISSLNIEVNGLGKQIKNAEMRNSRLRATNVNGKNDRLISKCNRQISNLRQKRNSLYASIRNLTQQVCNESADARRNIDEAESVKRKDIEAKQKEANEIKERIDGAKTRYDAVLEKNFHGFQAQMRAFNSLKLEKDEGESISSTLIASWLIMLLFITIETAPTFFRMMMEDGPYDNMVRAEKDRIRSMADMHRRQVYMEVDTEIAISTKKNERRLEAELQANEQVVRKVAEAQVALIERAVELWKEKEMKKVEENPGAYIATNDESSDKQAEDSQHLQ